MLNLPNELIELELELENLTQNRPRNPPTPSLPEHSVDEESAQISPPLSNQSSRNNLKLKKLLITGLIFLFLILLSTQVPQLCTQTATS